MSQNIAFRKKEKKKTLVGMLESLAGDGNWRQQSSQCTEVTGEKVTLI